MLHPTSGTPCLEMKSLVRSHGRYPAEWDDPQSVDQWWTLVRGRRIVADRHNTGHDVFRLGDINIPSPGKGW